MSLDDLGPHLFTQPDQPDWIPYVTSYYSPNWGFCLSEHEKQRLPHGDYRVLIDSELSTGQMLYAEAHIAGDSADEVLFSSYICHPSMANNELSGPVLLVKLLQHLSQAGTKPKLSYRFVLVPETIGSLVYLSKSLDSLRQSVVAGFVLSCVGDERAFSHIETRSGTSLADDALRAAFKGRANPRYYSFKHRGSDERQYGAPGIDLPVAGFCRSKYGEFPEYHTSADNFDVVTERGLEESFDLMAEIIAAFEIGLRPRSQCLGEPQMSRRGLYPKTSQNGRLPRCSDFDGLSCLL
jgi:Uncharacterized protein conserved in bacteria with an aminopeptidase-like domain